MQLKHRENVAVSTFSLHTENNGLDHHRIICLSGLPNIHLFQARSNNVTSAVALSNAPPSRDNNLTGFLEQNGRITRHSTTPLQDFQAGASLHVPQDLKISLRFTCLSGTKELHAFANGASLTTMYLCIPLCHEDLYCCLPAKIWSRMPYCDLIRAPRRIQDFLVVTEG